MEDHSGCSKNTGKDAYSKSYGIYKPVDKGMEPYTDHGDNAHGVVFIHALITYKSVNEPVEQVKAQVAGKKIKRRTRVHGKGFWNNVEK